MNDSSSEEQIEDVSDKENDEKNEMMMKVKEHWRKWETKGRKKGKLTKKKWNDKETNKDNGNNEEKDKRETQKRLGKLT